MTAAGTEESLAPLDVKGRIDRLRNRFDEAKTDALVVTKRENVRYLTGFTGSAGSLVVRGDAAVLITDSRYRDQASSELGLHDVDIDIEIVAGKSATDFVVTFASGVGHVGLEADSVSWSEAVALGERIGPAELVATRGVVEGLRIIKDEGEIARIEKACSIADIALAQVKERLREKISEREFAAELEFEMLQRGSAGPAFATIVAGGSNSAMPHARPTDRQISAGELVVIDFGATVEGYRSDMTRTLCVGELDNELATLVDAVFTAQRAGLLALGAGVSAADVDGACRNSLSEAGFGDNFLHSTGHGVGLEIHEAPWVSSGSTDILRPGTVVTVEPGAYLAGRGGVRIEDTVVITDSGTRVLTKATKDYTL